MTTALYKEVTDCRGREGTQRRGTEIRAVNTAIAQNGVTKEGSGL